MTQEGSSTTRVTTAVQPPRLKCPGAKPYCHDHSMMGILKCSGIFKRATSPTDLILIKEREGPRGTECEAKRPASGFSWIKLGKLAGMFSITATGKGRLWTSRNASELESYLKWKIIASIFSGALFKQLRNGMMTKTRKSSDKFKSTTAFNTIFKLYFYGSGVIQIKKKIFYIDSWGAWKVCLSDNES